MEKDFSVNWRIGLGLVWLFGLIVPAHADVDVEQLSNLSLEELGDIRVTSVLKRAETLNQAAAAVYVITAEDIRRSGATTLPEMLRLAPNLHVARINASNYAISARGFNGDAADKLLVLIDGRSVYTPYFSGVFWDLQTPVEDIERIEVISGPSATLWGANAMNGVINVVTRKSQDTQGGVVELGAGNREDRANLRYGGKLSDTLSYRVYGQTFAFNSTRNNTKDDWYDTQGGARFDWTPTPRDLITFQGDYFKGREDQLAVPNVSFTGHNLLGRWTHQMDNGSLQVQTYYDYLAINETNVARDSLTTYDLDVQRSFELGSHKFVVGGGYRVQTDNFPSNLALTPTLYFSPVSRTLGLGNLFVQDSIALTDRLTATVGFKLELDPYTGLEPLPSVHLGYQVTPTNFVWAGISRAIRAPSRLDRDLNENVGSTVVIKGGQFQSEKLIAYEVGYRTQPLHNLSLSASLYYNDYQDLRSAELTNGTLPIVFSNKMNGNSYGIEVWGTYVVTDWWRLSASFNWLHKNLHFAADSSGIGGIQIAGDDPTYQGSVRSSMNLARDVTLDLNLRRIGALPAPASPAYTELDATVNWEITPTFQVSVVGSNLLHAHHLEFGNTTNTIQTGPIGVETGRTIFVNTRWKF